MKSELKIDTDRGEQLAYLLYDFFSTTGILGNTEMPEDILPVDMKKGSREHLLFITLTVSIDYQCDAKVMWAVSRKTFEDPGTSYLFDPSSLHNTRPKQIQQDMQKYGLSKKFKKDAHIWRTVGVEYSFTVNLMQVS
jgi:hypothetical protein